MGYSNRWYTKNTENCIFFVTWPIQFQIFYKCANLGTLSLTNTKKLNQAGQKQFSFHSQRKRVFSKNDDVIENDDVIKILTGPK